MFGGYLPVERTTEYFFLKTMRRLIAQRGENAHTKKLVPYQTQIKEISFEQWRKTECAE
ncbi:hypothetical protein HPT25_04035 [Bacillus sp. BRMEA1]|nr:hypothetical protein [Neobacillus endophyticus]